jgi:hypothetical protein
VEFGNVTEPETRPQRGFTIPSTANVGNSLTQSGHFSKRSGWTSAIGKVAVAWLIEPEPDELLAEMPLAPFGSTRRRR